MLAWIRTGLALITFGFVVARVGTWMRIYAPAPEAEPPSAVNAWIGAAFLALGAVANGVAIVRFRKARAAIEAGRPLPADAFPVGFGAASALLGAALGAYVLLQML
jgi:putative membrane protein